MALLREDPLAALRLAAVALLAWLAVDQAGSGTADWTLGGAALLALLVLALALVPVAWARVPRALLVGLALLVGYVLWSYLSALWADDRGAAWEGATRTIAYPAVLALLGLWPLGRRTGAAALGVWCAVVAVAALVVVVRLLGTDDARPMLPSGRLTPPAGYPNATAALLVMAALPALLAAAAARTPPLLRGLAAGAAVLLADVALLCLSRGSFLATPITLAAVLVVLPDRLRRLATLVPVAAAMALAVPAILDLGDLLAQAPPPPGATAAHDAGLRILLGAVLCALVVGAVAALGRRRPLPAGAARGLRRAGTAASAAAVLVAVVVVALAHPGDRLSSAWSSFQGGYGQGSPSENRLVSGLGSNRYDFYRVGLDAWRSSPVVGIGVGGFFVRYLRDGRSTETPSYPHSLELRALAETGLVGAVLLLGGLGAVAAVGLRAARARGGGDGTRALAGGALALAAYWVVHGSADWFFELPGLGWSAAAALGVAAGTAPRRPERTVTATEPARVGLVPRGLAVVALCGIVVLLAGWAADHDRRRAAAVYASRPGEAYARLDRAAALDPLSPAAPSLAGSIALRLEDLPRARQAFARAARRVPADQYAQLQLGSIESNLGARAAAEEHLRTAVRLAPRDPLAREALEVVRTGGRVDLDALTRRILGAAEQLG